MATWLRSFILRRAALALAALLSACSDPQLSSARPELAVEADAVEFPRTFVGYPTRVEVEVRNVGFAPLVVEVLAARPFAPDASSFEVGSGSTFKLGVVFDPAEPGPARGRLELKADERVAEVAISGVAELPPVCPTGTACRPIAFDPVAGLCVETVLPDTIPCPLDDLCLVDPRCEAGECVGRQRNCDDKNACTRDSCSPTLGCVHQNTSAECPPPPSGNPCEIATCDPKSGCGVADADDGTLCGPADCRTADVCLLGGCRTVPTPEGFLCAPETPCQGRGVCHNDACDRPEPTPMEPLWTYEASEVPGMGDCSLQSPTECTLQTAEEVVHKLSIFFPGTVDQHGHLYLLETGNFCDEAKCYWGLLVSLTRDGFVRYRQPLEGNSAGYAPILVLDPELDALYVSNGVSLIEARRMSDGERLWTRDTCDLVPSCACGLCDAGTYDSTQAYGPPAIASLVPIGVPTQGLVISTVQGDYSDVGILLSLSPDTGVEQWRVSTAGRSSGFLSDEDGNLFFNDDACPITLVPPPPDCFSMVKTTSLAPDGQTRWTSFFSGVPLATSAGRVLSTTNWDALTFDARDGSVQYRIAEMAPPFFDALLTPQSLLLVSDREYVAGQATFTRVSALDPPTGAAKWTSPLAECAVPGTFSATVRGTLVGVTELCMPVPGVMPSPTHTLREIAPGGREVFACTLPTYLSGGSALHVGRWFAQVGISLQAFDAPGLDLAPRGWVTKDGNLSRNRRPR